MQFLRHQLFLHQKFKIIQHLAWVTFKTFPKPDARTTLEVGGSTKRSHRSATSTQSATRKVGPMNSSLKKKRNSNLFFISVRGTSGSTVFHKLNRSGLSRNYKFVKTIDYFNLTKF